MRFLCLLLLPLLLLAGSIAARADIVHLSDGTDVVGTVKRVAGGWTVTDAGGKSRFVAEEAVRGVEKVSTLTPDEIAQGNLRSLRHTVEGLSDLKQIIDRYQKFLEQNKGRGAANDAQADLAIWRDRQEKGAGKVGTKWVSADEYGVLVNKWLASIDTARGMIRQNRLKEAEAAVNNVLADDPGNVSALYLQALIFLRQDKLTPARKPLDIVRAALPDHAPTLNNLAVLMFRGNQVPGAMTLYEQAMNADPLNRHILDNVAEALHALTPDQQDTTQAQRAAKKFAALDAQLGKKMLDSGLYRWGSSWVNAQQKEQIEKVEAAIQAKLDALSVEKDKLNNRAQLINSTISLNDSTMQRLENDRLQVDATGRLITIPLPNEYYRVQNDNAVLKQQLAQTRQQLNDLPARWKQIEQLRPFPPYKGVQELVGVEGTPLVLAAPPAPASRPASQPATRVASPVTKP